MILDALIGAEQGVRHMTLGLTATRNLIQDVTALRLIRALAPEYLKRLSLEAAPVATMLSMNGAELPADEPNAYAVTSLAALTAVLGGATALPVVDSRAEVGEGSAARGIGPLRVARSVVEIAKRQRLPDTAEQREEHTAIERETRAILDRALELGDGDAAKAAVRAFEEGVIDLPAAEVPGIAGRAAIARDASDAVRFTEFGGLPFDAEAREFHAVRMSRA